MNDHSIDFQIFGITGYTVMCNYHLRDSKLSLKAKGLLSMMLSLSKDWDYSINGLEKISQEGKYSIRSTLDELKKAEYIKISRYKDEKGLFRYKYLVYYLPYSMWLKMSKYPDINYPYMDDPYADNCTQLNNNNKKDKIDKIISLNNDKEIEHNELTKELIAKNYISESDNSSFLFDDFFQNLLKEGNSYKDLLVMTNYIISTIGERGYKDENNQDIKNRFGYFKNSLLSNIGRFKRTSDELYSDADMNEILNCDWLKSDKEREDFVYDRD